MIVWLVILIAPLRPANADELIVSAAASLTDAFSDIEPAYEKLHPGVDVIMNFASSGALYRQIEQGAPVDVYASANPKWMSKAVTKGYVAQGNVVTFAHNALVLAVPADNPANIQGVKDLIESSVSSIGIGTPETVPAGQYAKEALSLKSLYEPLLSKMIYGESVRQVLDYLSRGEVDCGFIYRTDAVKAASSVHIVEEIPLKTPVTYPIAPTSETKVPELAHSFVNFVRSQSGLNLLEKRGFSNP